MYNIYNENDEKAFGCSSLPAVIEYMEEVGVVGVTSGSNPFNNKREVRINFVNSEYIILQFGCPTAAHDWIMKHVPGELKEVVSGKGKCYYRYGV